MRPIKSRRGARVIVVAGDEVLLQTDTDPGIPGSRWHVTPGGGCDDGETDLAAAVRELFEETGARVAEDQLERVYRRLVTHGYSDRILIQDETFFRVDLAKFQPRPAALTAAEQQRHQGVAWYPIDALPQPVWPADLAQIIRDGIPGQTQVEESTVPVTQAETSQLGSQRRDPLENGG